MKYIRRAIEILRRIRPYSFIAELLGLASIILISRGLYMIYEPLAWIFIGAVFGIPYVMASLTTNKGGDR